MPARSTPSPSRQIAAPGALLGDGTRQETLALRARRAASSEDAWSAHGVGAAFAGAIPTLAAAIAVQRSPLVGGLMPKRRTGLPPTFSAVAPATSALPISRPGAAPCSIAVCGGAI